MSNQRSCLSVVLYLN